MSKFYGECRLATVWLSRVPASLRAAVQPRNSRRYQGEVNGDRYSQVCNSPGLPSSPPPTHPPTHLPCPSASAAGEQRAQVKGIKERSLVNKARNEAKKEMEEAQSDQPLHFLRVDGRSAAPVRNDAQFFAIQQNEGLVPWAARPDVLIDRYDVRSLLDIYVDPDPRCAGGQCALAVRQRVAVAVWVCAGGQGAYPCCWNVRRLPAAASIVPIGY